MAWPPTVHQDVTDEVTSLRTEVPAARGWASTLLQRLRIGENLVGTGGILWITGRYYSSNMFGTSTTSSSAANRLYLTPMYLPAPRNVDRIGINVTLAGAAGSVARLGVYNSDPTTGLPSTVLVDGGTVAISATGAAQVTVSATLHGLVWLACTSGAATLVAFSTSQSPNIMGASSLASLGAVISVGKDNVDPTVALPNLTGATLTYGITSTPPAVAVRAV